MYVCMYVCMYVYTHTRHILSISTFGYNSLLFLTMMHDMEIYFIKNLHSDINHSE